MMMPDEPPELLESTGYLLARAGSESRRAFVEALAKQGLTLTTYGVLMVLSGVDGAIQRELADAVGIDPRNLVPVLDDLETRGLVSRKPHSVDRRRHSIRLTPAGRARLTRLRDVGASVENQFLEPLSTVERRRLHMLLQKILLTRHISRK